ncbi:hypothetical protein K492DRAFT_173284 [Lichtheimia hyalospora FSU 10163]|nr:hypothetical protein K492DRAFT_173284 [Lichtheimia hyalospora FSU 10163]
MNGRVSSSLPLAPNWCRHWAITTFFLVHINLQARMWIPWMFSRQDNIFVCTLWSRPGLFVPTLFGIHDVSLTPTRKAA